MPSEPGAARGPSGARTRSESDARIVEAEARYHRERLALYRARALSGKPTSRARLQELERASASADARLRHLRGR
jgi:hypothetical protein